MTKTNTKPSPRNDLNDLVGRLLAPVRPTHKMINLDKLKEAADV